MEFLNDVDVIIPNYNRTTELERAVSSIENQENVARVIIVDDGSDEDTRRFYAELSRKYPFVEVLYCAHTGDPGFLRKIGIWHSSSNWIAFLDSDDEWLASKTSKQLKFAHANKMSIVCSNAWNSKAHNQRQLYFEHSRDQYLSFRKMLKSNSIITSTVLVKRELLESIDLFAHGIEVTNCEDYATWLRILAFGPIGYIESPLIIYHASETSFSRNLVEDINSRAIRNVAYWAKVTPQLNLLHKLYLKFMVRYFHMESAVKKSLK